VEELGQRLLENLDASIDGVQLLGENRARAARGLSTEEAPATPLAFTTRERGPLLAYLLWHRFGRVSKSR